MSNPCKAKRRPFDMEPMSMIDMEVHVKFGCARLHRFDMESHVNLETSRNVNFDMEICLTWDSVSNAFSAGSFDMGFRVEPN